MNIVLNIIRYIVLLIVIFLVSALFPEETWALYDAIFKEGGGSWIDFSGVVGLMMNYTFFVPFFCVLFGERNKYWVIGIFLIPILLFEFSSGFSFVWIDATIATAGLTAGILLRLIINRTIGKMPRFAPYKKYF